MKIPIKTTVEIKKFLGRLRICWVPSELGVSWSSFVGEPIFEYEIVPVVLNH